MGASVVMALVSLAAHRWAVGSAWGEPVTVGLATFLSWAIGREIDPDRVVIANLSCIAGGVLALVVPGVSAGAMYLVLVAIRVVVRTTGLAPRWTDLAAHLPIAVWLARSPSGWATGMALAFALGLDACRPPHAQRSQLWWSAATAVAVTITTTLSGALGDWTPPRTPLLILAVAGLVATRTIVSPEPVSSVGDLTGGPLDPSRLRLGRTMALVTVATTALVAGETGIEALAPVWAVLVTAGTLRLRRPRSPAGVGLT